MKAIFLIIKLLMITFISVLLMWLVSPLCIMLCDVNAKPGVEAQLLYGSSLARTFTHTPHVSDRTAHTRAFRLRQVFFFFFFSLHLHAQLL